MTEVMMECDRISDRIVDMINAEMERPDVSPVHLLAGQLLALESMLDTMPEPIPDVLLNLHEAVKIALGSMDAFLTVSPEEGGA